jgi:hypothetical protein
MAPGGPPAARSKEQRKADTLAKLAAENLDGWVSSAPGAGRAHLVPLSMHWTGDRLVIAVEPPSVTARNILETRVARIGLGATRDVVMMDVELDAAYPVAELPDEIGEGYAAQSDWDPRAVGGDYVYLVLRPTRVQAWREVNELSARALMRDGAWLV